MSIQMKFKVIPKEEMKTKDYVRFLYTVMNKKGDYSYCHTDETEHGIINVSKRMEKEKTYQDYEKEATELIENSELFESVELLRTNVEGEDGVQIFYSKKEYQVKEDAKAFSFQRGVYGVPEEKVITIPKDSVVLHIEHYASIEWRKTHLTTTLAQQAIKLWDKENATEKQKEERFFHASEYHDFYPQFRLPNPVLIQIQEGEKLSSYWMDGSLLEGFVLEASEKLEPVITKKQEIPEGAFQYRTAKNYQEYLEICKETAYLKTKDEGSSVPFKDVDEWISFFGAKVDEPEEDKIKETEEIEEGEIELIFDEASFEEFDITSFDGDLELKPEESEYPVLVMYHFSTDWDRYQKHENQIWDWKPLSKLNLKIG